MNTSNDLLTMMDTPNDVDILTFDEVLTLAKSAIKGGGPQTEEQIEQVIEWAQKTRVNEGLLGLVLAGRLTVHAEGDDVMFKKIQGGCGEASPRA